MSYTTAEQQLTEKVEETMRALVLSAVYSNGTEPEEEKLLRLVLQGRSEAEMRSLLDEI